ncbi:hypothetical protein C8Q80DRAFT_16080 [Daedaleopsis nitida]|nr:hypothetical protein C8Q80DRAFT_16080 [Daedaleopsis nitida]
MQTTNSITVDGETASGQIATSSPSSASAANVSQTRSSSVGTIVSGTIGGLVLAVILALLLSIVLRRHRRHRAIQVLPGQLQKHEGIESEMGDRGALSFERDSQSDAAIIPYPATTPAPGASTRPSMRRDASHAWPPHGPTGARAAAPPSELPGSSTSGSGYLHDRWGAVKEPPAGNDWMRSQIAALREEVGRLRDRKRMLGEADSELVTGEGRLSPLRYIGSDGVRGTRREKDSRSLTAS